MSDRRLRAKELAPSILVTLLSIIQALALEVLWSGLGDHPHLWLSGWPAWIGWFQVAAVVQGIALVWIFYTTIVMRFVWLPNIRDSIIPFLLGLGEFVLASLLEPDWMWLWFLVNAGVFVFASLASYAMFATAEREPENRAFFSENRLRLRDMLFPEGCFVTALIVFAGIVYRAGPGGGAALVCMLLTNLILFAEMEQQRRYWKQTMFPTDQA